MKDILFPLFAGYVVGDLWGRSKILALGAAVLGLAAIWIK